MTEQFTLEDEYLMGVFDSDEKPALIRELIAAMPYFNEPEMAELAKGLLIKFEKLGDLEFSEFQIYPDYDDIEESEG